jgi:hypothetical protein
MVMDRGARACWVVEFKRVRERCGDRQEQARVRVEQKDESLAREELQV